MELVLLVDIIGVVGGQDIVIVDAGGGGDGVVGMDGGINIVEDIGDVD